MPDGKVRTDWWNFLQDGEMPPEHHYVCDQEMLGLIYSGKTTTVANILEAQEKEVDKNPKGSSWGYSYNPAFLITMDDNLTGGVLAREINRRNLRCAKHKPHGHTININPTTSRSPYERGVDIVASILEATAAKAEDIIHGAKMTHDLAQASLPEKDQVPLLSHEQKTKIWEHLLKKASRQNIEKILRIGHYIKTPENQGDFKTQEDFQQKIFEMRWNSKTPSPLQGNYEHIIYDKKRFLTSEKPIIWAKEPKEYEIYQEKHVIKFPLDKIPWLLDDDVPLELLAPDLINCFLHCPYGKMGTPTGKSGKIASLITHLVKLKKEEPSGKSKNIEKDIYRKIKKVFHSKDIIGMVMENHPLPQKIAEEIQRDAVTLI